MLEHATLLLRPPDASRVQAVVDAETGAALGFARGRPAGGWGRWLGGATLEVHEQQDASLLCTIRRGWLRRGCRLVYDADERGVGLVRGRRLEDRHGRLVAAGGPDGVFRDPDGRPLATLRAGAGGLTVAFAGGAATDPFARMLVLAAALRS